MTEWFTAAKALSDDDSDDADRRHSTANEDDEDLNAGSMLRFGSVADVSKFFRGELVNVFNRLQQYGGETNKNALTKDDPEYEFVQECSRHVLTIEVEKTKVHKFIRDHYSVRFPELATLASTDSYTYARVVKIIGNAVDDLAPCIEQLRELLPSQLLCAACACAATTPGRSLIESELSVILEGCEELIGLEEAKQLILEYIQGRTVLICPNLCAFLGTGIASQLLAIAGSITAISTMDSDDLAKLGSQNSTTSGVKIKSAGFLVNCDLVACHPPELRQKALRLVATRATNLARIDDNRRAADSSEGLRAREELKRKMVEWTDPLIQQVQSRLRGLANKTYERRTRRRAADKAAADRSRRAVNRSLAGKF